MGVKFTKCQAHVIFFDIEVGWKKRLDKIHISMRNALTVKITQLFIFDSQPFFLIYIHLYRQHMIRPSLHTHLWTMDTETYKYLKNETFAIWKENIKTCFPPNPSVWAKIFPTVPSSIGVYNEFLELHSVKQRVSAGPVESLTFLSIFGTPADSETERIIRPIPPACKYTNHSQKCTVQPPFTLWRWLTIRIDF